jgi:hypothetical protein
VDVTILLEDGEALVVRCDECRRLWPVTRAHVNASRWTHDDDNDLHRCPVCSENLGPIGVV